MATRGDRNVGLSFAAAGAGIIGSPLLGLTTASGGPDWVGIITATAGLIMVVARLVRAWPLDAADPPPPDATLGA